MFFKFILYNLMFQIIVSILMLLDVGIFDFSALTEYSMIVFLAITVLINVPIYFLIKYEKK